MWTVIEQIKAILSPPCLLCGGSSAQGASACQACLDDLPHNTLACSACALPLSISNKGGRCPQCAHPDASQVLGEFQWTRHCYAALYYLPPVTGLIHAFKDHRRRECGRLLSECLSHYMRVQKVPLPQLLVPMPLHPKRERQRGFNQAALLAQLSAKELDITWATNMCERLDKGVPQRGKSGAERRTSKTLGFRAYALDQSISHVAIVDDVITTGASVQALAKALQKANDSRLQVDVWSVARALPPSSALHWV